MQTSSCKSVHLSEWQRNYFAISSGICSSGQKADAYRAHILHIQYAWANAEISQVCATKLFKKYAEKYSSFLDSDNVESGLNNYAENILTLATSQQTDSDKWKSGLAISNVLEMSNVQEMMEAGKKVKDSLLAPVDASVVIHKEAHAFDFPKFNPTSSEENKCLTHSSHATDGFQGTVENIPSSKCPQNVQTPTVTDSSKAHPTFLVPLGESTTAKFHTTPLFGNVIKEYHGFPKANVGLNVFSSYQSSFPSGCESSWERKTFYGVGNSCIDALPNPIANKAFSKIEDNCQKVESSMPTFKTAKKQLWVDQQKKHHHPQRTSGSSYGGVKKSLGAGRYRGIFGKFIPPIPKQDGGDQNGGMQCKPGIGPTELAHPIDECLKNLEPKMVELIMNEIMDHGPPVNWDDIAGVEFAKTTIKEIVVWPMLRPDIFTGLRGPPKGILLFGPPGTGKTLIGKCIASQSGATFFSISASSLTSKWVGEGEKMVRALFSVARSKQPAVIFIDEIDSLLSQRGDGEHESSRRIKTEFLVQLDGATTSSEDRILVVGATNRPQEIDEAARRRLVKRLYIPLPEASARKQIIVNLMSKEHCCLKEDEIELVVQQSNGFSGADMTQLCREASLGPIRSLQTVDIATITPDQVRPISYIDFENALRIVRPSVSTKDLELYEDWNKTFGCGK